VEPEAAADELYTVPPEEFVAARTRLAAELSGDDARLLKSMRRPTVSAWAVNQLSREGAAEPLLELGERVRAAWSHADGIASLERERAELVGRLVRRTRALAEERGRSLSESVIREIEDTLQATVADADSAQAVRAARLARPLSHAGFGAIPMPPPSAPSQAKPKPSPDKPMVDKAEQQTKQQPEQQPEQQAKRDRLAEAVRRAEQVVTDLEDEIGDVTRSLAEADEELSGLRTRLGDLEKARADLYRKKQRVSRERDRADRVAERARKRMQA
jgi:hypothetical protein